jgi:hypothetical protein
MSYICLIKKNIRHFTNNMPHINDNKTKKTFRNAIQKQLFNFLAKSSMTEEDLDLKIKSKLEISEKQLTYWKRNLGIQPSIEQFKAIAKIIDCTVDDLIDA